MSSGNLNMGLSALTDTGQWKLIIEISLTGIVAILKNTENDDSQSLILLDKTWDKDSKNLLENIESAIYDNPRILDDFATHVIINTPRSLWIPEDYTDDEEFDPIFFTSVYPSSADDIQADFCSEEVCLYTLKEGLKAFLQRTLPGARVTAHINVLKQAFQRLEYEKVEALSKEIKLNSLYVVVHQGEVDILSFRGGRLQSAATHPWKAMSDLVYRILLVAKAYDFNPELTGLSFYMETGENEELQKALSKFFPNISLIGIPQREDNARLSLTSSIASGEVLYTVMNL